MSLEARIMDQMKTAMKAKDEAALRALRAIKAEILKEKTAANAKESLSEADELKMLQRMAKQRKDSLEIFRTQQREDLAKKEEEELEVISRFLPQQMSAEELRAAVQEIITQTGASSPADMGKVMGAANRQLAGRAEGKAIADTVKELLAR
jgi:uncharacterized protein YqeY